MNRKTKLLFLSSLFSTVLILSAITGAKLITVGGITFTITAFSYAITFFVTDVISECYGVKETRKVVYVGLIMMILSAVILKFFVWFPAAEAFLAQQEAFSAVLNSVPRFAIAGVIAAAISQYWDLLIFHKLRIWTKNRHLWLRNNASTISSQFIDSTIFITIAFAAVVPFKVLLGLIFGQFLVKAIIALVDTPFIYLGRAWVGVPESVVEAHGG